jgi:hypothetical protein
MEKKLYMVETVSIFRQRYVVEAYEAEHAADEVVMNVSNGDFKEFSQKHIDELITSTREISATEFLKEFDADNDYLSKWDISQKMQVINSVDYRDDYMQEQFDNES